MPDASVTVMFSWVPAPAMTLRYRPKYWYLLLLHQKKEFTSFAWNSAVQWMTPVSRSRVPTSFLIVPSDVASKTLTFVTLSMPAASLMDADVLALMDADSEADCDALALAEAERLCDLLFSAETDREAEADALMLSLSDADKDAISESIWLRRLDPSSDSDMIALVSRDSSRDAEADALASAETDPFIIFLLVDADADSLALVLAD